MDRDVAPPEFFVTWTGCWVDGNRHHLETSPSFAEAADAVVWGNARAPSVFISLDDHDLWAGDGDAPQSHETGLPMEVFDPADPRATQQHGRMVALEFMRVFRGRP